MHLACEQGQKPLAVIVTAGQRGDAPQFTAVMEAIAVPRPLGRPRTRPDRVLADRAYASRAIRSWLRRHGIAATIPEPADRVRNRARRGSAGGRPPAFSPERYKDRHAVEKSKPQCCGAATDPGLVGKTLLRSWSQTHSRPAGSVNRRR